MVVISMDHSLSWLSIVYTGSPSPASSLFTSLYPGCPLGSFHFHLLLGKPFISRFPTCLAMALPEPAAAQVPHCQHPTPGTVPSKSCRTSAQAGPPQEGHGDKQQHPRLPATSTTPINSHPAPGAGMRQRHREAMKHHEPWLWNLCSSGIFPA